MKKQNNKFGKVFWITGYSGAGKTSIADAIKNRIYKIYGNTIVINGDDLRNIFELNKYSKSERYKNGIKFVKLLKFLSRQKVNVLFTVVGLKHSLRRYARDNIPNYIEIFIDSNLNEIIKFGKKKTYKQKRNIVGKDINAELPKNPDILIRNNFSKSIKSLSNELYFKLKNFK